jgi:hypothetical protein
MRKWHSTPAPTIIIAQINGNEANELGGDHLRLFATPVNGQKPLWRFSDSEHMDQIPYKIKINLYGQAIFSHSAQESNYYLRENPCAMSTQIFSLKTLGYTMLIHTNTSYT